MEEDQGEDEDSGHHAEGRGVVGVGLPNEPLVLVVAQRDHRDLEIGEMSKKGLDATVLWQQIAKFESKPDLQLKDATVRPDCSSP